MDNKRDNKRDNQHDNIQATNQHDNQKSIIILVDADATPRDAVQAVDAAALETGATVVTVSSINHEFDRPGHITVDAHPQAVDMEIVSQVHRNAIFVVVTQDYGLAALVLGKGARAISPRGLVYTDKNIDRLLLERDLSARARKERIHLRGPKARTKEDAQNFAEAFRRLLSEITGPQ